MTTNKPKVVAWRWRKPIVNDQGETVGATAWELSDAPEFLPWWTNEPLIRLSDYEALQAECEKLRKDAERYRSLLEAVQGEPVGYVSPRLLKSLLSGKACGITMEDKPDAHNGVTIPLYIASPAVQMEVVGWQFYEDGKWWNGDDRIKDHKRNTQEAGYHIRDVYAITGQS